jgi:putative oxidoreductase
MATTTTTPNAAQDTLALIGRILIATLFIPAGFGKLMGFAGTVGYITKVAGLPLPEVAAAIAIIVELGLGIALLVGFKTRWTALIMAIFTVATACSSTSSGSTRRKISSSSRTWPSPAAARFRRLRPGRFSIDKR